MPYNIINAVDQYQLPISGVETIAALREIPNANSPAWTDLALIFVGGGAAFRDGGFSIFMWDPTSVAADNGVSVIQPTDITAAGRWRLVAGTASGAAPGAALYVGSGSPEGVVTAAPGSRYTDTATGDSYSKRTGTGNTGWV